MSFRVHENHRQLEDRIALSVQLCNSL